MKNLLLIIFMLNLVITLNAQQSATGLYRTSSSKNVAYYAAIDALSSIDFAITGTDMTNGIIQAEKNLIRGRGRNSSLFLSIREEEGKVVVKATFTKASGINGVNLAETASEYGNAIKKIISDLEITVETVEVDSEKMESRKKNFLSSFSGKPKNAKQSQGEPKKSSNDFFSSLSDKPKTSDEEGKETVGTTTTSSCMPSATGVTPEGDSMKYYGGDVRKHKILSDDKSAYKLFLLTIGDGKKGTFLVATFRESVKESEDYHTAVNNYLNQNSLANSTLQLGANNDFMIFKATSCTHQPLKTSTFKTIVGYSVTFVTTITKEQITTLQNHDIQQFMITLGGKPFQTTFKKSNEITNNLKTNFSCIDIEAIEEIVPTEPQEVDMTEVDKSAYSSTIVGKWTGESQGQKMQMILSDDGKFKITAMGSIIAEGTYKIVGDRFIYSSDKGNGASKLTLFVQDMFIEEEKGNEQTWTRIK
jgi:hypothetical protein